MRRLPFLLAILALLGFELPAAAQSPLQPSHERTLKASDTFRECASCPEMVVVTAGAVAMGSPDNERARAENEGPQHEVTMRRSFALGKFHVTLDEFITFVQETAYDTGSACDVWKDGTWEERLGYSWRNPGFAQTGTHPATCLSWDDAQAYLAWLSRKTGRAYRLPVGLSCPSCLTAISADAAPRTAPMLTQIGAHKSLA